MQTALIHGEESVNPGQAYCESRARLHSSHITKADVKKHLAQFKRLGQVLELTGAGCRT
jgi:hypothetical protein